MQDLQPSLASAVKSINRWHLIQSSVPYILQCCSLLLSNRGRLGNVDRLGNAERELLYTLHWILLEGPRICCVVDTDSLLYPLTTIEQFVHELTPHVHRMRESDLTFRLENGVAIWGPLWKHEKPSVTPFTSEVIRKDADHEEDDSKINAGQSSAVESDPEFSAASFFDVAVLKCLSSTGWDENGVVWALRYLASYLTKEFDLPDQVISREPSGEIRVGIPVHQSSARGVNPNTKVEDNVVKSEDITKPDGTELVKITVGDAKNLGSENSSEANKLSACTCQIEDSAANNTMKDEESVEPKSVENLQLAVPQSTTTDNGDRNIHVDGHPINESPSDEQDALKIPESFDGDRLTAQGLERTGSIKLRIRVQSSPGLSPGGRVLTAVASPTGSDDDSQDLGDTGTFQNTKVYIKPSNMLHVPSVSKEGTNKQNNNGPLLDEAKADEIGPQNSNLINYTSSNVSTNSFTSETPLEVNPVEASNSIFPCPGEIASSTVPEHNEEAVAGPGQISNQQLNSSSGAFESMVSYECEVQYSQTESGTTSSDQLKDASLYKRLSEHASSSHASSSSVESESQPLLKPSTAMHVKPLTILGAFDSPQSINRDSFMRTDRYFVFPGAADYITTDGRLSSLMILHALNSIMRENPTSLICDATLTVLQHLVTVHENKKSKKRGSAVEVDDRTVAETQAIGFRSPHSDNVLGRLRASFYGRPPSFLNLAMGCLVSLVKALGCPLGKYHSLVIITDKINVLS